MRITNWNACRAAIRRATGNLAEAIANPLLKATKVLRVPPSRPDPDLRMCALMADRRHVHRRYRRTGQAEDERLPKTAVGRLRGYFRRLALRRWRNCCATLGPRKGTCTTWRTISTMSGVRQPNRSLECLALTQDLTQADLDEQFSGIFTKASPTATASGASARNRDRQESRPVANALNTPFTMNELIDAIRMLRTRSAPGPDGYSNRSLRNLPEASPPSLLSWYNEIWATGEVPSVWRSAWVVPILKAGKPTALLTSYHPISLISCVAKLFERMVQRLLVWFLESQDLLPQRMFGYMASLSSQDCVLDLVLHVQWCMANRMNTTAVFLDLQKAYDNVRMPSVIQCSRGHDLSGNILAFLEAYLTRRTISVKLGSTISRQRPLHRGPPQGSTLSPVLFNVIMAQVAPAVPRRVSSAFFADDI